MTIFSNADAIHSICDMLFTLKMLRDPMRIHFQNDDVRSGHWPIGPPEFLTILGLTVSLLVSIVDHVHSSDSV